MFCSCVPQNAAARRYQLRLIPAMVLYVICIISAAWVFRSVRPVGIFAYALALAPALPIIGVIVIVGLYLAEETDEFQRNLLIQSILWGIGGVLVLATMWGFLELFTGVPHFQVYLTFPLFWFFVGIAGYLLRLRYR